MSQFPLKKALITGGGSGIGRALAHLLSQKGISLVIVGRNKEAIDCLAKEVAVPVEAVVADLSTPEGRRGAIEAMERCSPDLVVNSAGMGLYGPVLSHSFDDHRRLLEVNGTAAIELSIAAARHFQKERKQGIVMNISSAAATYVFPFFATYAASKALLSSFSQAFDEEMQEDGIRILTSCPGMVATPFQENSGGKGGSKYSGALDVDEVARLIWKQIEEGKQIQTISRRFVLARLLTKLLPQRLVRKKLRASIERRLGSSD